MKQLLLCFYILLLYSTTGAQTWCAPGATWFYRLYQPSGPYYYNGYIKLEAPDTVSINGVTCFSMTGTYTGSQGQSGNPVTSTNYVNLFTYEHNRVVYIYNPEESGFDTIADFDAAIGSQWLVLRFPFFNCMNNTPRFAVTVSDTGHVTINAMALRSLTLSIPDPAGTYTTTMIEKIISTDGFLFPHIDNACGGGTAYYGDFSCYSDNNFATYHVGSYACNYITGIEQNALTVRDLQLWPNPAEGRVTVQSTASTAELRNNLGQTLYHYALKLNATTELDLADLPAGIYYLKAGLETAKLIKH